MANRLAVIEENSNIENWQYVSSSLNPADIASRGISADDTDSSQEPLTPNHLLLMQGSPNLPPGLFTKNDNYSKGRWAQVRYLSDQFCRQGLKEFLPNLLQRQKWFMETKNLLVNDVVLLVEDSQQGSRSRKGFRDI